MTRMSYADSWNILSQKPLFQWLVLMRALVQYFSEILIEKEVSRQYYSVIAATGSISHVIIAWTLGSYALHPAIVRISISHISSLLSLWFFSFLS